MNAVTLLEHDVAQMEYDWGVAFEQRDFSTLDRMMADEYILTDPLGHVRSKAETLAALENNEVQFETTRAMM